MKKIFGIGIDCAPGMPRPNVYADHISKNIFNGARYTITSKCFGHWEFRFEEGFYPTERQRNDSWAYLTSLYKVGLIRYADQGGL